MKKYHKKIKYFWYADIDPEQELKQHNYKWQPCLQTSVGAHPLSVWFRTKEECQNYIEKEIIGATLVKD
jgi:hypothetical protein